MLDRIQLLTSDLHLSLVEYYKTGQESINYKQYSNQKCDDMTGYGLG